MNRLLIGTLCALAFATAACDQAVTAGPHAAPDAPRRAAAAPAPSVGCDGGGTDVATADQLTAALAAAKPGDLIRLAAGDYAGHFTLAAAGTAGAPITLCGPRTAVLDGGDDDGYTLHLDHADHTRVAGLTVRGGQKGVMVDASSHVVVDGIAVTEVGEEAVHLRRGSSDNVVRGSVIRATGLRTEKFGEGIYVGSAKSNWCTYSDCQPDRSDRNVLEGNDIAEHHGRVRGHQGGHHRRHVARQHVLRGGHVRRRRLGQRQGQRMADRRERRRRRAGGRLPDPPHPRRLGRPQHASPTTGPP